MTETTSAPLASASRIDHATSKGSRWRAVFASSVGNALEWYDFIIFALFSIYIRPKYSSSTVDAVLSVKCYQDDEFSDAPVVLNDWSPMAIKAIAPNADFLNTHDLYWGAGTYVEKV